MSLRNRPAGAYIVLAFLSLVLLALSAGARNQFTAIIAASCMVFFAWAAIVEVD